MTHARQSMMTNSVKVKRGPLLDCLTCPICSNLLREATTICVCLHTFCKECIYQKFEDDDTYCCPICNVYLGCLPQEKLRADNNLQEVRMKVFPLKKAKEIQDSSTQTVPGRRKERSLSSLVISTNPISSKPGIRTKPIARKADVPRVTISKHLIDKDATDTNNHLEKTCYLEHLKSKSNKLSMVSRKQPIAGGEEQTHVASCAAEPPTVQEASIPGAGKDPSWEQLAFLAEAANQTEDSNMALLGLPAFKTKENGKFGVKNVKKFKRKGHGSISSKQNQEAVKIYHGVCPDEGKSCSYGSDKVSKSKKPNAPEVSTNGFFDKTERRLRPIWFALLCCDDQISDTLSQMPNCYIRVKDGNIPVSYIKRYLVQKLNVRLESEVELTCCGQPLVPSLPMRSVVDIWLRNTTSKACGSKENGRNPNALDFVMVLKYSRKTVKT